nr:hypothetical protein [uncultured Allomuricauda sp.]
MTKKSLIVLISGILIFVSFVIYKNLDESNLLNKDGIVTTGEVVKFRHLKKSSYRLFYKYKVDEKYYQGALPTIFFKCDNEGKAGCVGNKFNVIYSKSDPSVSDINLEKYNRYKGMHLYY